MYQTFWNETYSEELICISKKKYAMKIVRQMTNNIRVNISCLLQQTTVVVKTTMLDKLITISHCSSKSRTSPFSKLFPSQIIINLIEFIPANPSIGNNYSATCTIVQNLESLLNAANKMKKKKLYIAASDLLVLNRQVKKKNITTRIP